ncbi:MAG: hypothetical protein KAV00_03555 [Phycisphaerae bacterium]|nr:hypothetical protein [Phycisphaerae bacterium]
MADKIQNDCRQILLQVEQMRELLDKNDFANPDSVKGAIRHLLSFHRRSFVVLESLAEKVENL